MHDERPETLEELVKISTGDIVVPPARSELSYILGTLTRDRRDLDVRKRLQIGADGEQTKEAGDQNAEAQGD